MTSSFSSVNPATSLNVVFIPSSRSLALLLPKSIDLLFPPICLVNNQNRAPTKIASGTNSTNIAIHSDASGSFVTFNVISWLSDASVIFDKNSSDFGKLRVNISFSS